MTTVLMLGSAPMALEARLWPRGPFDRIVAINNAYALRPDWDFMVHPWDFPATRVPVPGPGQTLVTEADFVPAQKPVWRVRLCRGHDGVHRRLLGSGGTQAVAAGGVWLRHAVSRRRADPFLRSGHARPAAPRHHAAIAGGEVGPSDGSGRDAGLCGGQPVARSVAAAVPSRRPGPGRPRAPVAVNRALVSSAMAREAALGYQVPSGRYWEELHRFDPDALAALDALWLAAVAEPLVQAAASA